MAWVSWEKMCQSKENGGMGFKDLKSFNKALLAKQGWRLQTNTQSLFSRVFKETYFPDCKFINATLGKHPSFAWKSIMSAQVVVRKGRRWRVAMGKASTYGQITSYPPNASHRFSLQCRPLGQTRRLVTSL